MLDGKSSKIRVLLKRMINLMTSDKAALQLLINEPIYNVAERVNYAHFDYIGDNNNYILLLSPYALPNAEKDFLLKILSAVNLTLVNIALLDLSAYPGADIHQLKRFFACNKIISFGIPAQTLGIPAKVPDYHIFDHLDIAIVTANTLREISADNTKKAALWASLKQIFAHV